VILQAPSCIVRISATIISNQEAGTKDSPDHLDTCINLNSTVIGGEDEYDTPVLAEDRSEWTWTDSDLRYAPHRDSSWHSLQRVFHPLDYYILWGHLIFGRPDPLIRTTTSN
jgi:hypothetical protein